jgi:ornithine cyclodeaminase/alanine dehydrogenase-like protein (mu-crystallin family)
VSAQHHKILVLNAADVERLLTMDDCIELMSKTLADLARDVLYQPLRMIVRPADAKGLLGLMPAYRATEPSLYGLKAIAVFPENPKLGKDAHQGSVMLFSGESGELLSLMNASPITAIRTAAVSAVSTKLLARDDATRLAIIGAGVEARSHLPAIASVRQIQQTRVVSRTRAHADAFVSEMSPRFAFPIEAVNTSEEALKDADIIVTVTNSREPVINLDWISPGAHINAIGTHSPASREIDGRTMAAARLFVDRRESAINEAGDYVLAVEEGLITADSIIGEIGELLIGTKQGRTNRDDITLFKSLGLAVEDLACAQYLFEKAKEENAGSWVSF